MNLGCFLLYNEAMNGDNDTGLIDERPVLGLDVKDNELIQNFRRWEEYARSKWNNTEETNLQNRRERNVRYHLGKQIDTSQLYDFQIPYIQNELFVAAETITAYTTTSNPTAEVLPERDDHESKTMAENLEWALNSHTAKFKLADKIEKVERNLYLKYIGIIKLYYDANVDDVVPKVINPDKIVLDPDCPNGGNPLFIAETCSATLGQIINLFPEKKKEILESLGKERMSSKLSTSTYNYKEVWFTQIDDGGETECVAWYMGDVLLGKAKNPNFLYKEDGVNVSNFLDVPAKPYVFFNYINDGDSLIDITTPFEQAIPLQDLLNRRGRQIMENADTANSVLAFKASAISEDKVSRITRKPNQTVLLKGDDGEPISNLFAEIQPHMLPNYVLNDKQDIKNSIHEIMGTPNQFRGSSERGQVATLGEAQMVTSQASGRQDVIVRNIERGIDNYYRLLVQMMKVWYKDTKKFACKDNDGKFMLVELSRAKIPDNVWVSVEAGSTQKMDKARMEDVAIKLAQLGLIDPYNLFKDLGMKNAENRYETLVKFKMSPDSLSNDLKADMQNKQAYIDFACIMNGEDVKPHDEVDAEHILAHRTQITTDRFLYASPERQKAMITHIQAEVNLLSQRVKLQEASMQGLLVDPNMPVTPEVPEPMPQEPQQPDMQGAEQAMPQGMPMEEPMPPQDMGSAAPQDGVQL